MSKTEQPMIDDAALEAFFVAARSDPPVPSDALMARIMADAEAEAHGRDATMAVAQPARRTRRGLIATVIGALGGWPAMAGMVTATMAGVWFGFAAPDEVNALAGGLLGIDSAATATAYDLEDIVPGGTSLAAILEDGA